MRRASSAGTTRSSGYPRRQVPEPVTALATSDRNLASRHHELQQLGDGAIVGPTRECPGLGTAICKIHVTAAGQRTQADPGCPDDRRRRRKQSGEPVVERARGRSPLAAAGLHDHHRIRTGCLLGSGIFSGNDVLHLHPQLLFIGCVEDDAPAPTTAIVGLKF